LRAIDLSSAPRAGAVNFAFAVYLIPSRSRPGAEEQNYVAGEGHVGSSAIFTAMPDQPEITTKWHKKFAVEAEDG
jgi:hypothetical protein